MINNILRIGFLSLNLLYFSVMTQAYAAPQIKEYQVKATFTQIFTGFIKWPEGTFSSKLDPLQICVIGENPFGLILDILVRKYNEEHSDVNSQVVSYLHRSEDISHCHLVYLSDSEESYSHQILNKIKGKPILTVSSIKGFVIGGGMIQFYVRDNRVRFLIDPTTIRDSQLKANANFLRVADIVGE